MAKFYATSLAARPLVMSGKTFKFEITGISAGRAFGVLKTEAADEISILDAAVAARRGVKEIDEAEYANALEAKKKAGHSLSSNGSKPPPRVAHTPKLLPDLAVEGKGSAASAGQRQGDVKSPTEVDTEAKPKVKDLIRIERVNPPQPFARSNEKVVKASKRASSKAARLIRQAVG